MRAMRWVCRSAVLAVIGLCAAAHAQDYPTKPVHVLTPFAPGGILIVVVVVLVE